MAIRKFLVELLTVFSLAILLSTSFGQGQGSSEQFYTPVVPDVVIVNYRTLYLRSQFGIRVASEYQDAQLSLRAESTYFSELFEDEESKLAEIKSNISASEFESLVEDFDARVETRRMLQDSKGVALGEWESQQREIFQAYISPIIIQVAQVLGTKLVLPSDVTFWHDESLDITPYVLTQANATFGDGTDLAEYRNPHEFSGIEQ